MYSTRSASISKNLPEPSTLHFAFCFLFHFLSSIFADDFLMMMMMNVEFEPKILDLLCGFLLEWHQCFEFQAPTAINFYISTS